MYKGQRKMMRFLDENLCGQYERHTGIGPEKGETRSKIIR